MTTTRVIMRALWLLLEHAGLSATREARQVRAWLDQHGGEP